MFCCSCEAIIVLTQIVFWHLESFRPYELQPLTCNLELTIIIEKRGSTTWFIRDRVREHLNNDHEFLHEKKKHIQICQKEVNKSIKVKVILQDNNAVNLWLFKAFYIRKHKPTLNSQQECSELTDLLFLFYCNFILSYFQEECSELRDHLFWYYCDSILCHSWKECSELISSYFNFIVTQFY